MTRENVPNQATSIILNCSFLFSLRGIMFNSAKSDILCKTGNAIKLLYMPVQPSWHLILCSEAAVKETRLFPLLCEITEVFSIHGVQNLMQ